MNNKKVIADLYGGAFIDAQEGMDWSTYQAYFEPFFGKKPKEVKAQLKEAFLTVEDPKIVELIRLRIIRKPLHMRAVQSPSKR